MGIGQRIVDYLRGVLRRRKDMIVDVAAEEAKYAAEEAFLAFELRYPAVKKAPLYDQMKTYLIAEMEKQIRERLGAYLGVVAGE